MQQHYRTKIIAEIGTAHGGSLKKAFALIDAARDAGADAVKFQWVYADEILHPETGFVPLPGGAVRLYDRYKALEVPPEFFSRCQDYARAQGMLFACSPFGVKSLRELAALAPDAIKIASPEVNHLPLLRECAHLYGYIPLILSSGVSKLGDIEQAVDILAGGGPAQEAGPAGGLPPLTVLHCLTFYPAPEEEYNVRCVDTLRRVFGTPAGISDHSLDPVLVPVLATAMGAVMIEKHITLSRATDGLDDPVALEPEQFAQMVHAVHNAEALREHCLRNAQSAGTLPYACLPDGQTADAGQTEIIRQLADEYGEDRVFAILGTGIKRLARSELANYGRTNRSLHYLRQLKAGDAVTAADIAVLRTEKVLSPGISPALLEEVMGGTLCRDVESGAGVQLADFIHTA